MKILSVLVVGALSVTAHAKPIASILPGPAVLVGTIAPQQSVLGIIQDGTITIDKTNRKITLNLLRGFHCPPGAMCAQVMPAPLNFEVPLESIQKDKCGSVTYKGHEDLRPIDGVLTVIEVVDHTYDTCTAAQASSEVIFKSEYFDRLNSETVRQNATLQAYGLSRLVY